MNRQNILYGNQMEIIQSDLGVIWKKLFVYLKVVFRSRKQIQKHGIFCLTVNTISEEIVELAFQIRNLLF